MAGCFRSKPPSFEQAAVPQRCRGVEAPFQLVASTLIQPADVACSERYSSLLECAGKTWLLRRVEMRSGNQNSVNSDTWQTVLRTKRLRGSEDGFTPSHVTLPNTLNMSHNAAFLCDDGKIVAWGGRRKAAFPRKPYEERGIYRAVGTPMGSTIQWSRPQLVLDGSRSSGCTELRAAVGMTCEFDGKLSVTRHDSRVLLFARANLGRCGGHRAVQVTSSADGVLGWTRWRTLQFDGVSEEDSVYFAASIRGMR
ncbi:hypothetical protein AB1Y20_010040 [Prymnesium parvum]|uniref:Uncharacterized protein n=1 Tax=Prymnesium parvum TaxID=97485 RepID=A0AB34K752_PRYPA